MTINEKTTRLGKLVTQQVAEEIIYYMTDGKLLLLLCKFFKDLEMDES